MKFKIKKLCLFLVFLVAFVISVSATEHDASKKSIEKSAVVDESIKAWEICVNSKTLPEAFRRNIDNLKYIDEILSSNLGRIDKTNLLESKIRNSDYEHGAFLDNNGQLSYFRIGHENKVDYTDLTLNQTQGKYFTHNHPNSGVFSDQDIITAAGWKVNEYTAVTRSGKKYIIQRTASSNDINQFQLDFARNKFKDEIRIEYANQYSNTLPGSPERIALDRLLLEELDKRTLSYFNYNYIKQ
jgi:hypothetical protein